jgi:hypothetical protein
MKSRLAGTVLLFLAVSVWGQNKPTDQDTVRLGADLHLGLTRQFVLSRLAGYRLEQIASCDCWSVRSKDTPPLVFGEVIFTNDKLDLVEKDWTPDETEDSFVFAQALQGALEQFSKEGRHTCQLNTNTTHTPWAEMRSITLFCGAKRLVIQTTEILAGKDKGKAASIQEILTSEEPPPEKK